jgi:Rne/Rng family ribonuclease
MTKELFVSSTPHETKVGLVEDDQLAEIYLERENEYTLAGSIYKGRVTRVLPGMQSAFVDIGLERDAFLYVSDFMELEDADEVEELPTQAATYVPSSAGDAPPSTFAGEANPSPEPAGEEAAPATDNREGRNNGEGQEGRGWRGRRRRGRGRRGDRMPESRFARPGNEAGHETPRPERNDRAERPDRSDRSDRAERSDRQDRPERAARSEYGPPAGYQPIILPGESISKYQRLAHTAPPASQVTPPPSSGEPVAPPIARAFPEDEPFFTNSATESQSSVRLPGEGFQRDEDVRTRLIEEDDQHDQDQHEHIEHEEVEHEEAQPEELHAVVEPEEPSWNRELNSSAASGFGDGERETAPVVSSRPADEVPSSAAAGTLEEEEIEEEEADLASYVEELEEDAAFDEMEEETRAAADQHRQETQEIVASGEPGAVSFADPAAAATEGEAPESDEAESEEAELEEAQAEAEALLDAEARGDGSVEARAEVRAPAGTAGYTQRAQRPAFDRQGGQRGRRGGGGGGRRFRRRENLQVPQISDLLKEGQEILVQIAKEPIGKKGARITSHIALPGRFLVYMPTVNHTGVSRKIASEEERQRLKRIILSERENGHGGFIVRTAAQGASEDELRADIRFLKGLWTEIKSRAENGKSPALIYHDLNVVERVLRDQVTSDFSAIWVDTDEEYERILRFANRFQPALVKRVKLYSKETPLFEQFGLTEEINKALKSKVWLKSGGYIVINQTEALVAIDVNTGKYVGKTARLEDTIVKTNVDAIKEIVRQIRLRDLGGIIVIDFIDMDERRNRQKVMQALEEALRSDRAP